MNCIPRCDIIYCVFRFMSPLQPSLSLCNSTSFMWSSEICLNHLSCVFYFTDLTTWSLSDTVFIPFCILQTPHGWFGRSPYYRAGGWGYLNTLILLQRGWGEKVLLQWKVVILYLTQPYDDSTLHTSHIKPLKYKSLWIWNLSSLGFLSDAADLATLLTSIWVDVLQEHWGESV